MTAELAMELGAYDLESLSKALESRVAPTSSVRLREPMSRRTTLRVGGPADLFVEPGSEPDLAAVLKFCAERHLPVFVLGRGSNLLVKDGGLRGAVVCLSHPEFSRVEIAGERVNCGAGAKLKAVAQEARRHALSGLEFLEGIPGSVGGALRMNAGAMGGAIFECVESVRFMNGDGELLERAGPDMAATYRSCHALKQAVAISAVLKGTAGDPAVIGRRMTQFSEKRWNSQPAAPSAGCMFKNPAGIPAGKLIDELGLKGTRVGGAMVAVEHGNFIVNDGSATAADVLELIQLIRERARAERGIELEPEVQIVGE